MHIMSTNFAKTLVWKHANDVKLWRHKQCTPNANDQHATLNRTPPWNFYAYATDCHTHADLLCNTVFRFTARGPIEIVLFCSFDLYFICCLHLLGYHQGRIKGEGNGGNCPGTPAGRGLPVMKYIGFK